MLTDYHAKYYAHELTRRYSSSSVEGMATTLMDAQVDLNPHQIDAALFAFRSPLSKGAILADEVGLGKTIEAGIVLAQKWAERKRKILVVVPSSLRKQWCQELADKFFLPSHILEAGSFNRAVKDGCANPFAREDVVIASYHFAKNKAEFVLRVNWDLVVVDEAHRVRNVYKSGNKIARALKDALRGAPKILLTATPLQNSLLELFGLVSFIDDYAFGDLKSFRTQYARLADDSTFDELKARLLPVCKRTLRRQVAEYIRYTNRIPITQEFIPTPDEEVLYDMVSDYLRRENLTALPASQRTLMTLVLRKLLASSTFAIAGALDSLVRKLAARLRKNEQAIREAEEALLEDFEASEEIADESEEAPEEPELLSEADIRAMENEIGELAAFRDLAVSISENAKGHALLKALEIGFGKAGDLGAAQKAILFTESRRTQAYLLKLLSENGYAGRIVLFNGVNGDPGSREVYAEWKRAHEGTSQITGSQTADMRSALVDHFKEDARIMIATEAAAEGINLQFCSLVVNYDLPWNPQRIEQRIGRCHRYGQKHDVVVVNFLNKKNAADQRVYELLAEKFKLFSGVFGASDEVLGSIESGVDFEKRIAAIYQNCRTQEEIQDAFDRLQAELSGQIDESMRATRQKLLEHFDEEVHEKLRVNLAESREYLNKHETLLWLLTRTMLDGKAEFPGQGPAFLLSANPFPDLSIPLGRYEMGRDVKAAHVYRPGHPLAQRILSLAAEKDLPPGRVVFDYTGHPKKVSILEPLIGKSGVLALFRLSINSLESEDHLIFAAQTRDGEALDPEACARLFSLPGRVEGAMDGPGKGKWLDKTFREAQARILEGITQRNMVYFDEEMDKLDHWANDQRNSLKTSLKALDDAHRDVKRRVRQSNSLPEKITLQKRARKLEKRRDESWRAYDEAARKIETKKDAILDEIEARLAQDVTGQPLFRIQWMLR